MAFLGIDVDRVIEVKYGDSLSKIEDVSARTRYRDILTETARKAIDQKLSMAQSYYDELTTSLNSLLASAQKTLTVSGVEALSVSATNGTVTVEGAAVSTPLSSATAGGQKQSLLSGLSTCTTLLSSLSGVLFDLGVLDLSEVSSGIVQLSSLVSTASKSIKLIPG